MTSPAPTSPSSTATVGIGSLVVETPDPAAAEAFYAAWDVSVPVDVRASDEPSTGFRAFTLSLLVSQPSTVDTLVRAALEAGATALKPAAKSFWGYGGVVQAPDGSIWKVASSSKRDKGPATREIDSVVLLLGVRDVKASKAFYAERGLSVGKSFGGKYAEFDTPDAAVKLALYTRRGLAKDAGVSEDGSGSHRIVIRGDAGSFTDPDGFAWVGA
jgi:predicted lactoylglutathione lyase